MVISGYTRSDGDRDLRALAGLHPVGDDCSSKIHISYTTISHVLPCMLNGQAGESSAQHLACQPTAVRHRIATKRLQSWQPWSARVSAPRCRSTKILPRCQQRSTMYLSPSAEQWASCCQTHCLRGALTQRSFLCRSRRRPPRSSRLPCSCEQVLRQSRAGQPRVPRMIRQR